MKFKSKNIIKYLIIIIFLLIILGPQILFFIVKDNINEDNSENRKLADKPELTYSKLAKFSTEYNNYYNDHLPFRGILKTAYSNFIFNFFNETTSGRVLVGKSDESKKITWLLYQDDADYNPIKEAQGITTFSDNDIQQMKEKIIRNTNIAKEKNIELYYIICPDKENIYKDKIPDNIKIHDNESRTDKLVKRMVENEKISNIIYPKEELIQASKDNQTYYKQDTHWNNYGAFIGTKTLINNIEKSNENYFNDASVIKENQKVIGGDLLRFSGIKDILEDNNYTVNFIENAKVEKNIESKVTITHCENPEYDKTLMILGDSYSEGMVQFCAKLYKNVIRMHRDDYNNNMIEKYKPDIIVLENVERYTNYIKNFEL